MAVTAMRSNVHDTGTVDTPAREGRRRQIMLWLAVFIGPASWAIYELAAYALVKPVCASGSPLLLIAAGAGALVPAAGATTMAWSFLRQERRHTVSDGARQSRFLATAALGLNALTALLIVLAIVPAFILSPCE
jgi:hypothetical protein